MMRKESFEAVDLTLRAVCGKKKPFGGILTICCGYFRQLLPVIKRGNDVDVENACIKRSRLWGEFKKFNLKKNMRLSEEEGRYSEFLLDIGEYKILKNENGEIELPEDMILPAKTMEECIDIIYPTFENSKELFSKCCILVPLNDMVRKINSTCIRRFPGIIKEYYSFNTVSEGANATHFPTEFLDSVELSGLPPHKLELKIGSPIILMRNLDPPRLCNGTRMIVQELHQNFIIAKIKIGEFKNYFVMKPRLTINLSDTEDIPTCSTVYGINLGE